MRRACLPGSRPGTCAPSSSCTGFYHPRLSRFLTNILRRPQLVEEALNDTLMVVWKRPEAYNGMSKVSTWIFAIAYRTALKARSRNDEPVEDHEADRRVSLEVGPEQAMAQLSGSLTLASDVRLRGFSLTERRPAISLSGAYDDRSGLYAGGALIAHDREGRSARLLGHTEYLGYAVRAESGLSWDAASTTSSSRRPGPAWRTGRGHTRTARAPASRWGPATSSERPPG